MPALIFGLLGLILIIRFCAILIRPFLGVKTASGPKTKKQSGGFFKRLRNRAFLRCGRYMQEGDALLGSGKTLPAYRFWRHAFYLIDDIETTERLKMVNHHNMELLGKIISQAETKEARLHNLPVVEGLLARRSKLLADRIEAANIKKALTKKDSSGKKRPDWATQEYTQKLTALNKLLQENSLTLETELNTLFDSLAEGGQDKEVTYH